MRPQLLSQFVGAPIQFVLGDGIASEIDGQFVEVGRELIDLSGAEEQLE